MSWGVERRLEFIEFRLFWEGRINRIDVVEKFGVSTTQASGDVNRYLALAPQNAKYDRSVKAFLRLPKFKPRFLKPDASRYLAQLRSIGDGVLVPADAWLGRIPAYDAAPTPARGVKADTLRIIASAIASGSAVEVSYQSLSRPAPAWRWISPHAFAFDGFRWHTRAYCNRDGAFKDFLLSRIIRVRGIRESTVEPDADSDWHDTVTLEISPHPGLSDAQKKIIAVDYGMRAGKVRIPVRKALLYYALRRLGLDTDPTVRRPQDQQIVLLNPQDLPAGET